MQIIHWFTSSALVKSPETTVLLDSLFVRHHNLSSLATKYNFFTYIHTLLQEGVVDPSDSALRDFCARCIKEYLKWTIKQTSKKVESSTFYESCIPFNFDDVIRSF